MALGAWGWHCAVAPAVHHKALKRCWKKAQLSLRTRSCLPLCTHWQSGGCLAWAWGGAAHCRHDYRKALLHLERQEGETSALSNLPSCSCSHPALLYRPDTFKVKALGKTLACVFPADGWTPRVESSPGLCSSQASLSQIRGGSGFFNDNYISERVKQQLIVRLIQFL